MTDPTKTFAFSAFRRKESIVARDRMDMLRALERASKAKPGPAARVFGYSRPRREAEKMCSKCHGCRATYNLDWKPFCDVCHEYEHEVRRLKALLAHYSNLAQLDSYRTEPRPPAGDAR